MEHTIDIIKGTTRKVIFATNRMIGKIAKSIIGEIKMNETGELSEEQTQHLRESHSRSKKRNDEKKIKAAAKKKKIIKAGTVEFSLHKTQAVEKQETVEVDYAKKQQEQHHARFERWKNEENYENETMNKIHSKFRDISQLRMREEIKAKQIVDNLNTPTDKNPKKIAPLEGYFVASKVSVNNNLVPRDNLNLMRLMYCAHAVISKLTFFGDLKNFNWGYEGKYKNSHIPVVPIKVYTVAEKRWTTIALRPYIVTLHGLARIIEGKEKSIGGKEYKKYSTLLNSKDAKQVINLEFLDKDFGKMEAKAPVVSFVFLPDKKHLALYFHPAFCMGVLNVDRRILQDVPSNIFDIIKKVYRKISGERFVGKVAELALLNFFYRVIQINNQDKSGHSIRDEELVFSQRTKPQERKDIMSHIAETFANEDVQKLIYGPKLNGNIVEFSTKKFIGTNNRRHLLSQ